MSARSVPVPHMTRRARLDSEPRFLAKCQPLLPIVSAFVAVMTCMSGVVFEAKKTRDAIGEARVTQQETHMANWRSALQKVSFEEANLVPTAFLMESFDDDPEFGSSARQIERTVLDETNRPETFDLIFSNMVMGLADPERANEAVDIGRALDGQLDELWRAGVQQHPEIPEGKNTFGEFLRHPETFYSPTTQRAQLDHVLVLIWQLDTFSEGLACMMGGKRGSCAHPPVDQLKLDGLIVVNFPSSAQAQFGEAPIRYSACTVHHDYFVTHYKCDAPPEAKG